MQNQPIGSPGSRGAEQSQIQETRRVDLVNKLLRHIRSPRPTPERKEQILQILTSNPQFMTAFLEHRQQREQADAQVHGGQIEGSSPPSPLNIGQQREQADTQVHGGQTEGSSPPSPLNIGQQREQADAQVHGGQTKGSSPRSPLNIDDVKMARDPELSHPDVSQSGQFPSYNLRTRVYKNAPSKETCGQFHSYNLRSRVYKNAPSKET